MSKVRFGDIVKDVKNNVDRNNNPYEFYVAGDHMDSEDLTIRRRGRFSTDDVGPAFIRIFKSGQVLYGSRRTYLKKVAVADFDGICANTTFVLESKDLMIFEQRLLPFLMLSDGFTNWSISQSKGSTNPYVLFSDLAAYEFDLPPIAEQKVLAEKLWAAYEVKQSYLNMIETTEEMVKSQFFDMIGSKEWPIVQLKNIVHDDCPISYGIVQPGDDVEDGVPIVRPVDMNDTHLIDKNSLKRTSKEISDSYSRTILRGDEILVCVRGTTGLIALADGLKGCNVTRGITPLYFKPQYNRNYLYRAFLGGQVQKYIQANTIGSTLKGINMAKLRELPICMPPKDIQIRYASIADQADKSISELRKSIDAIDKVIKSLINENL